MLTVKELRKVLEGYPEDAMVVTESGDCGFGFATGVMGEEAWHDPKASQYSGNASFRYGEGEPFRVAYVYVDESHH